MKIVVDVSLASFVVACFLPAIEFSGKSPMTGAEVLGTGWSGIFAGVLAWYANPVWLLGAIMAWIGKPKFGGIAGLVALAIGCTTFSLFGKSLPADEGGTNQMTLVRLLPGCYFWLASLASVPLCIFFR